MSLSDYFKGPAHRQRADELEKQLANLQVELDQVKTLAHRLGAMDALQIQHEIDRENQKLQALRSTAKSAEKNISELALRSNQLLDQILVLEETILLESFALYKPKFKMSSSSDYKSRLAAVRERQKDMIKSGEAATGNMGWEVNGSKAEGRKLVNDMIKLVIRSFNNEADYCVDNVKFDNIELGEKRILKSFETCNRLGRVMTVELSSQYLKLKLDELHLAHEFQIKKQEEKEEAKRAREELREQQKLEQEIRAARDKIAK
jgi:hypothetical protein